MPSPTPGRSPRPAKLGPIRLPSDAEAIRQGYYFDPKAGNRPVEFIESFCRHSTGRFAGQPFLLEPWQRDFLRNLYGWMRPDGTRRFRETYVEIGKKNGKSTLLAALALYGICEEPGAKVFTGAVDKEQAGIIFGECADMIAASPGLSAILSVTVSEKRVVFLARRAFLQAMSADVPAKDGVNASLTILDELHRFNSPAMYDIMKYAGLGRDQPILAIITTAGHDRKSICWERHEKALAVLNGTNPDLEFLPIIYAADEKDDLDSPRTWKKANPSLGHVLKMEDFKKAHAEAKLLPRLWALFLRLRLCIWTEQVTRWIPLDGWDALADDASTWDHAGQDCFAALDLASVTDLATLSLLFPAPEDGSRPHRTLTYFFIPGETAAKRAASDKVSYPLWIDQGHMIETEGNAVDHEAIRLFLGDLATRVNVLKVGVDPWNAQKLANELMQDGFDVVEMRQGYGTLSGPSKDFERFILGGQLRHDGNPVLRWNVGNVVVETDASGNIKPSKRKSSEKIDGVVSTIMTIGLAMSEPGYQPPTITILGGN